MPVVSLVERDGRTKSFHVANVTSANLRLYLDQGSFDSPLAMQVWPALTTIRQPIPDMAAKAAQLLLRNLSGQPPDHSEHVLQSSLTFRHSTGPAPNRVRARSSKAPAA